METSARARPSICAKLSSNTIYFITNHLIWIIEISIQLAILNGQLETRRETIKRNEQKEERKIKQLYNKVHKTKQNETKKRPTKTFT